MLNKTWKFLCSQKSGILTLIYSLLCVYLMFGTYWTIKDRADLDLYVALPVLCVALIALVRLLVINKEVIPFNKIMIVSLFIFLIIFVCDISVTISNASTSVFTIVGYDNNVYEAVVNLNDNTMNLDIIKTLAFMIILWSTVTVYPYVVSARTTVKYVCYLFIFVTLGIMIYSYIAECNSYRGFIEHINDDPYAYTVKSFFNHRNNYGMYLFLAVFLGLYLHNITHKFLYLIYSGFVVINIFFTLCKTSLLLSVVLFVIYLIYRCVITFKEHGKRNLVWVNIFSLTITGILLVCFLTPAKDFINSFIIGQGKDTINTRAVLWNKSWQIISSNPLSIIFGKGYGTFSRFLLSANNADISCPVHFGLSSAHSLYIQVLGSGGFIMLLGLLSVIVTLVYKCVVHFKKDKEVAVMLIICILSFASYFVFEWVG